MNLTCLVSVVQSDKLNKLNSIHFNNSACGFKCLRLQTPSHHATSLGLHSTCITDILHSREVLKRQKANLARCYAKISDSRSACQLAEDCSIPIRWKGCVLGRWPQWSMSTGRCLLRQPLRSRRATRCGSCPSGLPLLCRPCALHFPLRVCSYTCFKVKSCCATALLSRIWTATSVLIWWNCGCSNSADADKICSKHQQCFNQRIVACDIMPH